MKSNFIKNVRESIKHWYLALITGLILIATGIWTFFSPLESYVALSVIFSISFIVSGIMDMAFAIANRKEIDGWGWSLTLGIFTFLVGVMLVINPEVSMLTLPFYVGFMLMFRSFSGFGMALDLKNYGVMEWGTLMVLSVLGILFSFILIWSPSFAGMTIVFWTGLLFITAGAFNVYIAIKMRRMHKKWDNISKEVKSQFQEAQDNIKNELLK
ncbi:MAG: HdeD family acid-resistance protein [Niabella sp.]